MDRDGSPFVCKLLEHLPNAVQIALNAANFTCSL